MKRVAEFIFSFVCPLSFFFLPDTVFASRALIRTYQSFYNSDSPISYLLIPTLMDTGRDQILLESGSHSPGGTLDGGSLVGLTTIKDDWLLLVALGEQNNFIANARLKYNSEFSKNFKPMQNPLTVIAGYKFWGQSLTFGISQSEFKNRMSVELENSWVTHIGYRYGLVHLNFHYIGVDQSKMLTNEEVYLQQPVQWIGLYELDSAELAIKYDSYFQKQKIGDVEMTSYDRQNVQVSYFDKTKIQDIQFNYRIEYVSSTVKNKITNDVNRVNYFPLTLGFESLVVDWLNLIGTVKQPLFINQGTELLYVANQTNVFVGAELRYKKTQINALLGGLSGSTANQNIDGQSLLSQVSLTYKF